MDVETTVGWPPTARHIDPCPTNSCMTDGVIAASTATDSTTSAGDRNSAAMVPVRDTPTERGAWKRRREREAMSGSRFCERPGCHRVCTPASLFTLRIARCPKIGPEDISQQGMWYRGATRGCAISAPPGAADGFDPNGRSRPGMCWASLCISSVVRTDHSRRNLQTLGRKLEPAPSAWKLRRNHGATPASGRS